MMVFVGLLRFRLELAAAAILLAIASPATAQLEERDFASLGDGGITYDPLTGLEWIDLTLTTDLSYFEISYGVGNTWFQDGWRYAKSDEICALFLAYGAAPTPCPLYGYYVAPADTATVLSLQALFGVTDVLAPGQQRAGGFFLDETDNALVGWASITQSYWEPVDGFEVENDDILVSQKGPLWGNFLVRPNGSSVPTRLRTAPPWPTVEVVDEAGDGLGNTLSSPTAVAEGPAGEIYVAGYSSSNVLRVTHDGSISEIIDGAGDGQGNVLSGSLALATDHLGNVFVSGALSDNVFKIAPNGDKTQILDQSGGGTFFTRIYEPNDLAVDSGGNLFVLDTSAKVVLQVSPDGLISDVLSRDTGYCPGACFPIAVATGPEDEVYVALFGNPGVVMRFSPGSQPETVFAETDAEFDFEMSSVGDMAVGPDGSVFLIGGNSSNVIRIDPEGATTEVIDPTGNGQLDGYGWHPSSVAVSPSGEVVVSSRMASTVVRVGNTGQITVLLDAMGDSEGAFLFEPSDIEVGAEGQVIAAGQRSRNVLVATAPARVPIVGGAGSILLAAIMSAVAASKLRPYISRSRAA